MTSFDFGPLLVPISAERPAGDSLRFDALYDEIKRLREHEDAALPQGVWQRELKRADWPGVAQLSAEALTTRTKDLQIAAWLTEAWLNQHGFTGFARGLKLVAALCRDFWPDLHPPIEEESLDSRLSPIGWIAEKLVLPLKTIAVTAPVSEEAVAYGWRHFEQALHIAKLALKDPANAKKEEERGAVTQAKFQVSVSLTPGAWFASLATQVAAAIDAIAELDAVLNERAGQQAPSLATLRDPLQSIHHWAKKLTGERMETGEIAASPDTAVAHQPAAPEERAEAQLHAAASIAGGRIASRPEAYAALRDAADYLMRTEPHSPVPYLVRRAVAWGNLSLAELLEELLAKNTDVNTVYTLLGMKRPG